MNKKPNYLLNKIKDILSHEQRGSVLDLGCGGTGEYSIELQKLGFGVTASDAFDCFKYKDQITFKVCDITTTFPFEDNTFDYILLLEVIEHLKNPYFSIQEIQRVLRPNGTLIISTPNIMNTQSRMRFLFEGSYEYFREPPLDQIICLKDINPFQLHIVPYRYQELEYLLYDCGFNVMDVYTSIYESKALVFLKPLIIFANERKGKTFQKEKGFGLF